MYSYGKTSLDRLKDSSEAVRRVMFRAIHYVDISILCTYRNAFDQHVAVVAGFSKVEFPKSDHNYKPSSAVDAGIYRPDISNVDYADHAAFGFLAGILHVCAIEEGCVVIWGHDWDHDFNFIEHEFKDRPHFLILTKEDYDARKDKVRTS